MTKRYVYSTVSESAAAAPLRAAIVAGRAAVSDHPEVTATLKRYKLKPTDKDADIVRFQVDVALIGAEASPFIDRYNKYVKRDDTLGSAKVNAELIAIVSPIIAKIDACRKRWRGYEHAGEFSSMCALTTFDAQFYNLTQTKRRLLFCLRWLDGTHEETNQVRREAARAAS